MAEVVLDPNFQNESYSDDDIDINNNDLLNYRGYFQNNDDNDEDEPKYFEHGAHFPYYFLYQKLEIIKQELESREIELATVKNKTEKRPASTNIFGNNNVRSRNRNNIQIDFTDIPKVNNEIEIENDNSKQHVNASAIALKMNKEVKPKSNNDKDVNIIKHLDKIDNDKGSKNKLTESVNVYTAFATKLKMNKKLNFSKKETANEEEIAKLNSGTNLVNKTSKTKAIHLSNEKTQKAAHSTTKTKNKLEKKIKVPDTTIYKKSRSKSKELSSSYHKSFANKATSNKNQSKLIANSINNILTSYKHKRNFNFSPGLHPQPTKIKGTANKGTNNLNEILAAISKTSYHKSRNIGALTNNLTNTKSNLQTERDKRNLTQQNNINNIGPNYTMMKTQPVLFQKKSPNPNSKKNKVNLGPASRNEVVHNNNITNKTSNFLITNKNYHNMMSNTKNITTHTNTKESNVNSTISKGTKTSNTKEKQKKIVNQKNQNNSNKKFKTYLDIKLNLYQKSNEQILNEIRKTIFVRGNSSKKQKSTSKSNKTLKGPTSMKTSSSSNTRNTKKDNSNININININNNKIVYNKIVNINTKLFENNKEKDVCKVAFNAKANLYSEQNKGKNNNIGKNNVIGCKSSSKCNGNNRNSNLNMHSNSMSRNKYYAKNPTNNTTSHIGQNKKMNFNVTLPKNANAVSITKAK